MDYQLDSCILHQTDANVDFYVESCIVQQTDFGEFALPFPCPSCSRTRCHPSREVILAIDIVLREVVSVGCDESIGARRVCDDQLTAVEEALPDFLT